MANALKNTPIPEDIVNFTETTDKGPVNAQQIKERNGRILVLFGCNSVKKFVNENTYC